MFSVAKIKRKSHPTKIMRVFLHILPFFVQIRKVFILLFRTTKKAEQRDWLSF